jgi:hypothetical protein
MPIHIKTERTISEEEMERRLVQAQKDEIILKEMLDSFYEKNNEIEPRYSLTNGGRIVETFTMEQILTYAVSIYDKPKMNNRGYRLRRP